MIRNLPRHIKQSQILAKLVEAGFEHDVCFVYVPMDFGKNRTVCSKGFAFVHFADRTAAARIIDLWHHSFAFGRERGSRMLNLSEAHTQGLAVSMKRWGASATKHIRNPEFRPLVLRTARHALGDSV